jgi:ketosteroid isomerase-like protein
VTAQAAAPVRRLFALLEELGPVVDELHPDFEIHDHDVPDAGVFRGREGFLAWIGLWGEAWESSRLEVDRFVAQGDKIVVLVQVHATGSGSGIEVHRRDGVVCTLRSGKLVRLDYYGSTGEALAAAGLDAERAGSGS